MLPVPSCSSPDVLDVASSCFIGEWEAATVVSIPITKDQHRKGLVGRREYQRIQPPQRGREIQATTRFLGHAPVQIIAVAVENALVDESIHKSTVIPTLCEMNADSKQKFRRRCAQIERQRKKKE